MCSGELAPNDKVQGQVMACKVLDLDSFNSFEIYLRNKHFFVNEELIYPVITIFYLMLTNLAQIDELNCAKLTMHLFWTQKKALSQFSQSSFFNENVVQC